MSTSAGDRERRGGARPRPATPAWSCRRRSSPWRWPAGPTARTGSAGRRTPGPRASRRTGSAARGGAAAGAATARTNATLAPDTASRWVRPDARKSARVSPEVVPVVADDEAREERPLRRGRATSAPVDQQAAEPVGQRRHRVTGAGRRRGRRRSSPRPGRRRGGGASHGESSGRGRAIAADAHPLPREPRPQDADRRARGRAARSGCRRRGCRPAPIRAGGTGSLTSVATPSTRCATGPVEHPRRRRDPSPRRERADREHDEQRAAPGATPPRPRARRRRTGDRGGQQRRPPWRRRASATAPPSESEPAAASHASPGRGAGPSLAGPMPATSWSSSTVANGPCSVR